MKKRWIDIRILIRIAIILLLPVLLTPCIAETGDWELLGPLGAGLPYRDPSNPDIIYAHSYYEGVYKTTDGGKYWRWMNNGFKTEEIKSYLSFAIDPSHPNILYLSINDDTVFPDEHVGLYRSEDGGENWTKIWVPVDSMDVPDEHATQRILNFKKSGGRTTTYGRLHPNKPAYTINTYFRRPNVGANFHPVEERLISIREAMRLQSLPDRFDIPRIGAQDDRNALVGNAVPPFLALAVAKELLRSIGINAGSDALGTQDSIVA